MFSDTPPSPDFPFAPSGTLLEQLNDEQRSSVTLPPEHALILAGAGSGKTRVLTTRIAWLLQTGQVSPGGILAVTFTNKAAKEMVHRLSAMLPVNVRGMWIGTFHGLCNRFLRAHWQLAQLPQTFQILDTQDQLSAIKRLCKQFNVDEDRFPPKQLQWFIGGCKEEGQRPGDVPVRDDETRRKVELYQLYEEQCQREGVVDFGELMLRSYELLRDNAHVREHYRRRFRHILVDEFQDTNKLQYAWLKQVLESSRAKYKFVFAHHVLGTGRGGVEMAGQHEWGGQVRKGENSFAQRRPGWPEPIHALMVRTGVSIFFQGHDLPGGGFDIRPQRGLIDGAGRLVVPHLRRRLWFGRTECCQYACHAPGHFRPEFRFAGDIKVEFSTISENCNFRC